jgi:PAS domain S-box-containing protein
MHETADFRHLPIGVLRLNEAQEIVHADARFCEIFECALEGLLGKALDELFSPRDRKGAQSFLHRLSRYQGRMIDGAVGLRIAGKDTYARVRMKKVESGWVVFVEHALVERDLVYEMLLAQERWNSIFSGSDDGIVLLNEAHRIVECNARFLEVLMLRSAHGVLLSQDAVLGRGFFDLARSPEFERIRKSLDEGAGREVRDAFQWSGRFIAVKTRPIRLPLMGGIGSCIMVRDVTEQRQLEELRIQEAQAHWAGMAEVATNVLHNLGNLCTSVIFDAEETVRILQESKITRLFRANELLASHLGTVQQALAGHPKLSLLPEYYVTLGEALRDEVKVTRERARELLNRVQLMKEVISSQQDYAKGAALTEPLSITDILEESVKIQQAALERHGVTVVRDIEQVRPVLAQRTKLTHVFINLVKNAKEAMDRTEPGQRRLTIAVRSAPEGGVSVRISDTGEGIPADKLEKVFVHGFTTKEFGHGFGLHFCATAMMEMGGQLTVESSGPSRGATFVLHFPAPA